MATGSLAASAVVQVLEKHGLAIRLSRQPSPPQREMWTGFTRALAEAAFIGHPTFLLEGAGMVGNLEFFARLLQGQRRLHGYLVGWAERLDVATLRRFTGRLSFELGAAVLVRGARDQSTLIGGILDVLAAPGMPEAKAAVELETFLLAGDNQDIWWLAPSVGVEAVHLAQSVGESIGIQLKVSAGPGAAPG